MTLHDTLKTAAVDCAADLGLPLGWEGDVFVTPAGPHLKGRIVYAREQAASLGSAGLTRCEGSLELTVATLAGDRAAESAAIALARAVAHGFPRGRGLDCDGGEIVFATPAPAGTTVDGARIRVTVRCPFYAIVQA